MNCKNQYSLPKQWLTLWVCLFSLVSTVGAVPLKKEKQYLSGTDNEHTVSWDFFCTSGRKSGYWTKIEVPSQWEQQGFGEYDYGRDYRTYGKKFHFSDETGIYRHRFAIPENWKERKVFIVFEGSMTDTEVKINGQLAGELHQGAFYRFRYDISDLLNYGADNKLEVTVHKMSANKSVNRAERYADYWVFGGIFRPVYLEAYPLEYIDRVAVNARADGQLAVDVFPVGLKREQTIDAEIRDADGKRVQVFSASVGPRDSLLTLHTKLLNPQQWTSETPYLYSLQVRLGQSGADPYVLTQKFGFRSIEIRQGDGVYVNGVKVKMKGINRHSFWPETGRCVNPEIDRMDVQLMKEMNLNAVRCSHYPPDQSFLEACDSLGLYVLDELAGWQNAYDTEVGRKLVSEMVIRDVNHPSIIFWSNGNEGGTNKELDDDFDRYDPSRRPVIHAHHKPGNDYNGIDCNHYENYYSSKKILSEGKIYMPTEFLHAQDDGGGAAGLTDFWELFWNSDRSAGGFTWAFADEGIVRTDQNGFIDVNRVNAPDGVLGPHREKEASFYAMRDIYCPVKVNMTKLPEGFNGRIPLENRYHFTNLNELIFKWQLVQFYSPGQREKGHYLKAEGLAQSPDVAPVHKGFLHLDLPPDYREADALFLRIIDPSGKEIACKSWKLKNNEKMAALLIRKELTDAEFEKRKKRKAEGVEEDNILPIASQSGSSAVSSLVTYAENDSLLSLKAAGISVAFSKKDGTIQQVKNDMGLPIPFHNGPVLVSGEAHLTGWKHSADADAQQLEFFYSGDLKSVGWKMYASGWLELSYEYKVEGEQLFTGISFSFPESDIIGVRWLGNGPAHVWKNRLNGGVLDVYDRMYNNILPGDNSWEYPPFKGYYADVCWAVFNTVDGKFTVVANDDDLFLRLFRFYGLSGSRNEPPLPAGDISFLDAIPPVGTKLAMGISNDTWNLGPQGQLSLMMAPVKRTLFFYFGLTGNENEK